MSGKKDALAGLEMYESKRRMASRIEMKALNDLIPYDKNSRTHSDEQVDQIINSINEFGFNNPILIDSENGIIAGHGRFMAATRLGLTHVPVVELGHLSDAQKRAYIIADNKLAENAGWDDDILAEELIALKEDGFEIDLVGFSDEELADLLPDEVSISEDDGEKSDGEQSKLDEIPSEIEKTAQLGASYSVGDATLHCDDCLATLKKLEPASVDALVCDPPAGISFMGKDWDDDKGGAKQWINWMAEVMTECLRVLKPGAHGLVWAIPRTSHWTATALEESGFEIRDVVTHLFGSGFPKSLNISKAIDKAAGVEREIIGVDSNGCKPNYKCSSADSKNIDITAPATPEAKQWDGWGTALKPASEHWILVRKPLEEKTVAANVLKYGTGGINIDGCRVGTGDDRASGGIRKAIHENNPDTFQTGMDQKERPTGGRFPANLVLDETAAEMLDAQSGVSKSTKPNKSDNRLVEKAGDSLQLGRAGVHTTDNSYSDNGGASRFFYVAKASKSDRGEVNTHPTVKPIKLMQYFVTMVTPPGGVVLDCFNGSGTTGLAALVDGFKYIGCEKQTEYADISLARWKLYTGKEVECLKRN